MKDTTPWVVVILVVFGLGMYLKSSSMFETKGQRRQESINHNTPKKESQTTHYSDTKTESKPLCSYCGGDGIVTCSMCNGTGKNNLGADCGCVALYVNSVRLGHKPTRTPMHWSCEYCN